LSAKDLENRVNVAGTHILQNHERTLGSVRRLSVLLVEDSRLLTDRLREAILNVPGAQLAGIVDSESEAVATLQRMPVDVVLLDIHLRHGTGFGVLRALTSGRHDNVVAIVLTNHDLGEYRRAAAELGARHFLDKMRDFDRLPALLQEIGSRTGAVAPAKESANT
jgi:two-component system, OmpR family, response regulator